LVWFRSNLLPFNVEYKAPVTDVTNKNGFDAKTWGQKYNVSAELS